MSTPPIILLVDDDPDFVEATCAVLESVPYRVLVAHSGCEGLALAQETRPDVIILDVIMPGEDGFQTLEMLRADRAMADVPVMILTSLPYDSSVASIGEANISVEDYLDKPIKPAELLQRVAKLVELRHATRNS